MFWLGSIFPSEGDSFEGNELKFILREVMRSLSPSREKSILKKDENTKLISQTEFILWARCVLSGSKRKVSMLLDSNVLNEECFIEMLRGAKYFVDSSILRPRESDVHILMWQWSNKNERQMIRQVFRKEEHTELPNRSVSIQWKVNVILWDDRMSVVWDAESGVWSANFNSSERVGELREVYGL